MFTDYALNIRLMRFFWKYYYICQHGYNYFLAIIVIYLYRNNIRFNKKFPFITPPSATTSHIIENVPLMAA